MSNLITTYDFAVQNIQYISTSVCRDVEEPGMEIFNEMITHKSGRTFSVASTSEVRNVRSEGQGVKDLKPTELKTASPVKTITGGQRSIIRKSPSSSRPTPLRRPHPTSNASVPVEPKEINSTSELEPKKPVVFNEEAPVPAKEDIVDDKPAVTEEVIPVHAKQDETDGKAAVSEQVLPVPGSKPKEGLDNVECFTPPEVEASGDGASLNDIPEIKACYNGTQEDNLPEVMSPSENGMENLGFQNLPTLSDIFKLECDYVGGITMAESFKDFTTAVFVEGSEDILSGANSFLASIPHDTDFKPSVGTLVAALSPSDETWYRAFVYSVDTYSYYVCYIDFGNLDAVSSVRPLPAGKYLEMPGLAMVAQLQSEVTPEVQNILQNMLREGDHVAFKVISKQSKFVKVTLTVEGLSKDVVEYNLKPWYTALPSLKNHQLGISPSSELSSKIEVEATHSVPSPSCRTLDVTTTQGFTLTSASPDRKIVESSNVSCSAPLTSDADASLLHQDEVMEASLEKTQPLQAVTAENCEGSSRHDTEVDPKPAAELKDSRKFWACDLGITEVTIGKEYSVMPVWVDPDNNLFVHVLTDKFITQYQDLMSKVTKHCEQGKGLIIF